MKKLLLMTFALLSLNLVSQDLFGPYHRGWQAGYVDGAENAGGFAVIAPLPTSSNITGSYQAGYMVGYKKGEKDYTKTEKKKTEKNIKSTDGDLFEWKSVKTQDTPERERLKNEMRAQLKKDGKTSSEIEHYIKIFFP